MKIKLCSLQKYEEVHLSGVESDTFLANPPVLRSPGGTQSNPGYDLRPENSSFSGRTLVDFLYPAKAHT